MKSKHLWIMLVCCLVPLAALVALKVFSVPLGTLGIFALLLLCPLGHFLLMRSMGHKAHHAETQVAPVTGEKR